MKSIVVILLCLSLCLCGCITTKPLPSDQLPLQTTVDTIPQNTEFVDVPYEEPLVAISTPLITEETLSDDGTLIFTYSFQDINLTMDDPVVAESVMDDFMHRNDFSFSAQPILDAAKASYTGQQDWKPYSCSIVYNPVRLDQGVLSFYGSETVDNGGPKSTSTNISVTYDLLSGKPLSLTDILIEGYSSELLINEILSVLEPMNQQGVLFADYEYIISDQFATNTPTDKWYFSNAGLCFYFSPYEIAPYNAGTVVACVPYSELIGLLKDIYFPAEQIEYNGSISVVNSTGDGMIAYQRITEVILQNDGDEYFLVPNGTALNVQLQVTASDNEDSSYTVYAATALTDGDAVMLQVDSSSKNQLRICYNNTVDAPVFP